VPIHLFTTEADLATVRRLSVRSAIGVSARHALADGKRTVWNQVAYEGEWLGHSAGEFEFTRAVFEQIVANFERRADPLPLTYGHPDGETASYMGAAGWIHALKVGMDDEGRVGLFAEMEFTERAAGQIKAGEQRHCSVVVSFDAIDEKTGEPIGAELYEVGLVLSAFVDGMRPLAASGRNRITAPAHGGTNPKRSLAMDAKELLEKVSEELPDGADVEQLKALIDAEHAKQKAIEGEGDEPAEDAPEASAEPPAMGKDGGEGDEPVAASDDNGAAPVVEAMDGEGASSPGVDAIVAEISAQGGDADSVAVDAFLSEYAAEIASKFLGAPGDGGAAEESAAEEMSALSRKVEASEITIESLQTKLANETARANELQKTLDGQRDAELGKQIDAAIECGAVPKERRESLLKLGRADRETFDATLATVTENAPPKGVPTRRKHQPAQPGADKRTRLSKSEQIAALSSRERYFYESQSALGKPHDEAITEARRLSAARA